MLRPLLLHGLIAGLPPATASTPWPLPPPTAMAPVVVPQHPAPDWSWDTLPTSMHGADKKRAYNESEIERLAKYNMVTLEKWYTPCGSQGPQQAGPECAVEDKTFGVYSRLKQLNPNITTILYWNSMFDFAFYRVHQQMIDLEAAGEHAFLRDETGKVIELCNDGNVYCNITTYDWTQPSVRELWMRAVQNATETGHVDGIFADHSGTWGNGVNIGVSAKDDMGPNQLCNGVGAGRLCYNFSVAFRESFNSWHDWATNYTQDMLSKTTGGPEIQGPYARMGAADACDFDSIREMQANGQQSRENLTLHLTVAEAKSRGNHSSCKPDESCIAAFLAAAQPYTYMHCMGNTDDLLGDTTFPEMEYKIGDPKGDAKETEKGVWRRDFASGTFVVWDNNAKQGIVTWAHQQR